jgi:hypothetical protein
MGTVNGPTFVVTFCATSGANDASAIRALRAVLKFALRRFNLKCVDAREIPDQAASPDHPARTPAPAQRGATKVERAHG